MSTPEAYLASLEFVIAQCWADGRSHSKTLDDGTQIYAYPHGDGVAWGVNGGECGFSVKRGIRNSEGADICET